MNKPAVICYLADHPYTQLIPDRDLAHITQINYTFGHIRDGVIHAGHFKHYQQLRENLKHHPHIKVVLSTGGWTADGFSQAMETKAGRDSMVQSGLQLVKDLNLDGLDWDWEYPGVPAGGIRATPGDKDNFTLFLLDMRKQLDILGQQTGKHYLQTVAVGAHAKLTGGYDIPAVMDALDTVNLMTYDLWGDKTTHVAALHPSAGTTWSASQSVDAWHKAGVPKEKLLIGGTMYYHVFMGVKAPGLVGSVPGILSPWQDHSQGWDANDHLDKLEAEEQGLLRSWDEVARAATWFDGNIFVSGDDQQSLLEKGRYIAEEGLGGIIFWEYNLDRSGRLLSAVAEEIESAIAVRE